MPVTITSNLYENVRGSGTGQLSMSSKGTVTANGVTAVVVSDPYYTVGDVVLFGNVDFGGTPNGPYLSAGTTGTGFSVKSAASDTGTYNWIRFTPVAAQTA